MKIENLVNKFVNNFRVFITILVFFIFLFSVLSTIYFTKKTDEYIGTISVRSTQGSVTFCFDVAPPVLDSSTQVFEVSVGNSFRYDINATSLSNDSVYYYDNSSLFEINESTGVISYTPSTSDGYLNYATITATHGNCPDLNSTKTLIIICQSCVISTPTTGGGGGGGAGISMVVVEGFEVNKNSLNLEFLVGQNVVENLVVRNPYSSEIELSISVSGNLREIVSVENKTILGASGSKTISVGIEGVKKGIFSGIIVIKNQKTGQTKAILVNLVVRDNDDKVLVLELDLNKDIFIPGESLNFKVDLSNLGKLPKYDVDLTYTLLNNNNEPILVQKEKLSIEDSLSLLRSLDIPRNISVGNYTLVVEADYVVGKVSASYDLSVGKAEAPLVIYAAIRFLILMTVVTIIFILIIVGIRLFRQRFHRSI